MVCLYVYDGIYVLFHIPKNNAGAPTDANLSLLAGGRFHPGNWNAPSFLAGVNYGVAIKVIHVQLVMSTNKKSQREKSMMDVAGYVISSAE